MTILSIKHSNLSLRCDFAGSSIELFSGGGGLAMAMRDEGFQHLLCVERDKHACSTLLRNACYPFSAHAPLRIQQSDEWPLICGDVRDVDFSAWRGSVEVVAAGVPCQPWSIGGSHRGCLDHRNLWPELLRCVRETQPWVVIAENVRGLLRPSFKSYHEYLIRALSAPFETQLDDEHWLDHDTRLQKVLKHTAGDSAERYDVVFRLVNAADYGVPQIRWRVFVIAFRADLGISHWRFPEPTHSEVALLESQASGEYWSRHGIKPRVVATSAPTLDVDEFSPWITLRDAISGMPEPVIGYEPSGWLHHLGWPSAREYPGHTANDLDRPSKTIKAGSHGVPGGECVVRLDDGSIRNLTVREAARVMTFPDDWWLAGSRGEQMRQLGNAVPVVLGRAIARSVADAMRGTRRNQNGRHSRTGGPSKSHTGL